MLFDVLKESLQDLGTIFFWVRQSLTETSSATVHTYFLDCYC